MFFKILCLRRKTRMEQEPTKHVLLPSFGFQACGPSVASSQFASRFRWDVAAAEALAFTVGDLRGVALRLRIRKLKALHIACAS